MIASDNEELLQALRSSAAVGDKVVVPGWMDWRSRSQAHKFLTGVGGIFNSSCQWYEFGKPVGDVFKPMGGVSRFFGSFEVRPVLRPKKELVKFLIQESDMPEGGDVLCLSAGHGEFLRQLCGYRDLNLFMSEPDNQLCMVLEKMFPGLEVVPEVFSDDENFLCPTYDWIFGAPHINSRQIAQYVLRLTSRLNEGGGFLILLPSAPSSAQNPRWADMCRKARMLSVEISCVKVPSNSVVFDGIKPTNISFVKGYRNAKDKISIR